MNVMDEILDFAIAREQEAVDFYLGMVESTSNVQMKKIFEVYASEEKVHKEKLQGIKSSGIISSNFKEIENLNIANYVFASVETAEMTYQDALIIAMKREEAAYQLYKDLADKANTADLQTLFKSLAQEEAKHKLRFEREYDQYILTEN